MATRPGTDHGGMRSLRASIPVIFAAVLGAIVGAIGVLAAAASAWAQPISAQECSGHPDALGTSRVLVLESGGLTRVGSMQYPQTLPLADKEVVLTFDDGPLPRYSKPILDTLAAQCVHATYFLVGNMARSYPEAVRRIYEAGHTIGTHSEDHPPRFQKLRPEKVQQEIDNGIAEVGAALGDAKELAPFFRTPGLARSDAVEEALTERSLVAFSADVVADDWHRRIKPSEIVRRAMNRLEARGKGILLLHDIHPATVAALPELLKKLKEAGFHVVHVVSATAERIEIAGVPRTSSPQADDQAITGWPSFGVTPVDDRIALPAPDVSSFAVDYRPWRRIVLADGSANADYLAAAAVAQWADPSGAVPPAAEAELPVPAMESYLGGGAMVTFNRRVMLYGSRIDEQRRLSGPH